MKMDTESFSALIKLMVFMALTGMATLVLALTLSNGGLASRDTYKAVFTDVTGVAKGDDVRIAGVSVGAISGVEIVQKDKALVTFKVDKDTQLTQNTEATLRFRNLVGQRYMALSQGSEGNTAALKPDSTIPLERTQEALDLNVLLNGFKPVFEALNPEDTNKLAFEIVQTLQGEAGNVQSLLGRVSSLTNTLAGRDQLIGDVVTNLSEVLDMLGTRDAELRNTITTLRQFVGGLKQDRQAILGSLDSVSELTEETASLLVDGRPLIRDDIKELRRLTKNLSEKKNLKQLENSLQIMPIKMNKLGHFVESGSIFNQYLCNLTLKLEDVPQPLKGILEGLLEITPSGDGDRCDTLPEDPQP
jgi:phospholipid/cholesterol/gamma-HCH transport system substrate-binding protein